MRLRTLLPLSPLSLLVSILMLMVGLHTVSCTSTSPSSADDPVKAQRKGKRKYTLEPKAGGKAPGAEYPPATPVPVDAAEPAAKSEVDVASSSAPNPGETKSPEAAPSMEAPVAPIATATPVPAVPPMHDSVSAPLPVDPARSAATPSMIPKVAPVVAPSGACLPWPRQVTPGMPVYFKEKNFVVTRLLTGCTMPDGTAGYDRNTQWMAMGIPCTGGRGKIDWTDKYVAPKQVAFQISNNCPMIPSDSAAVTAAARSLLGLGDGAKLLGYTSFTPQFWEIIGQAEADSGNAVELRSPQSLGSLWNKVREGQPLRVRLYGRENAWLQGDFTYEVEADIIVVEKNRFKMVLVSVKPLSEAELAEARQRCESLKPKRNCSAAF